MFIDDNVLAKICLGELTQRVIEIRPSTASPCGYQPIDLKEITRRKWILIYSGMYSEAVSAFPKPWKLELVKLTMLISNDALCRTSTRGCDKYLRDV